MGGQVEVSFLKRGLAMKRLTVLLCLVGFIVALPLSHSAMAAKKKKGAPPAKVEICHVTDSTLWPHSAGYMAVVGRVISVSKNAVDAHLAHGDFLVDLDNSRFFFPLDDYVRGLAEAAGLDTEGADFGALIPIM
jgi:hypothetical protein